VHQFLEFLNDYETSDEKEKQFIQSIKAAFILLAIEYYFWLLPSILTYFTMIHRVSRILLFVHSICIVFALIFLISGFVVLARAF
jgi:hypothetical protein